MAFPSNPTNGQTATVNGVVYTYDSTLTAWAVTTAFTGNVTVSQINATAVVSTGNVSGSNLVSSGTVSATGNVLGSNLVSGGTISATGNITGGNLTAVGSLNAVSIVESSSVAFKENIRSIENPLELVLQLLGVIYDRKDGSTKDEIGLLAEDVYKVIPNIVSLDSNGKPIGIMYTKLSVYLLEAIKILNNDIERLKQDR